MRLGAAARSSSADWMILRPLAGGWRDGRGAGMSACALAAEKALRLTEPVATPAVRRGVPAAVDACAAPPADGCAMLRAGAASFSAAELEIVDGPPPDGSVATIAIAATPAAASPPADAIHQRHRFGRGERATNRCSTRSSSERAAAWSIS